VAEVLQFSLSDATNSQSLSVLRSIIINRLQQIDEIRPIVIDDSRVCHVALPSFGGRKRLNKSMLCLR